MTLSSRPKWRILGDRGSIEAVGGNEFLVKSMINGRQMQTTAKPSDSSWDAYYENVCRHLQGRAKLVITAESAARVIGVLEAANVSAIQRGGAPVKPAFA
jgi:predicted dehydrogenase